MTVGTELALSPEFQLLPPGVALMHINTELPLCRAVQQIGGHCSQRFHRGALILKETIGSYLGKFVLALKFLLKTVITRVRTSVSH